MEMEKPGALDLWPWEQRGRKFLLARGAPGTFVSGKRFIWVGGKQVLYSVFCSFRKENGFYISGAGVLDMI